MQLLKFAPVLETQSMLPQTLHPTSTPLRRLINLENHAAEHRS